MKSLLLTLGCGLAISVISSPYAFGGLLGVTELKPMQETRQYFGAAKDAHGKILVFGGEHQAENLTNTVESYSMNKKWTYLQSMPGQKAWERATAGLDGKVYLFGGSTDSYPSTDVWAYDPVTNSWDTSMPSMPVEERDTVAVTAKDGVIYLFGGYWNYNTVQAFDPATKKWQIKSPMPTGRWAAAGALGPNGKIYVVGGGYPGEPDYGVYNTLEAYDPKTDTWETKSPMPTARNLLGAAFGRDGLLYAIGGEVYGAGRTGIIYDVIEAYNPHTDKWKVAGHLPVELSGVSVVADNDGNVHVLGGYSLAGVIGPPATNRHFYLLISGTENNNEQGNDNEQ